MDMDTEKIKEERAENMKPCPINNPKCVRGDGTILVPREGISGNELVSFCECWWHAHHARNLKACGLPPHMLTWDAEFSFSAARRHLEAEIAIGLDDAKAARVEGQLTRYGAILGNLLRDTRQYLPTPKKQVRSLIVATPHKRLGTYIAAWLAGRAKKGWGAEYNVRYYRWSDVVSILATYRREEEYVELCEGWRDTEMVIVDDVRPVDLEGRGPLRQRLDSLLATRHSRDLVTVAITAERNPHAAINLDVWHEWLVAAGAVQIPIQLSAEDLAAEALQVDGVDEMLAEAEDMASRWLYPNLVVEGGITIVHGASGTGKSLLALDAALAAANPERRFLSLYGVEKPRNVLYVDEDSNSAAEFNARVKAMGVGEAERERFFRLCCQGIKIDTDDSLKKLYATCKSKGVELLVLDSLKTLHSKTESNNDEMRAVMDRLKAFTREGISVLLVHHDGKSGEDGSLGLRQWRARGASAIVDACDLSLALIQDSEVEGTVILTPGKRRSKNTLKEIRYKVVEEGGKIRLQGKARQVGESSDYNQPVSQDDLCDRIVEFIKSSEDSEAATSMIKAEVKGKAERIVQALEEMVSQKRLEKIVKGRMISYRLKD
jgi:RecA-family ATPase